MSLSKENLLKILDDKYVRLHSKVLDDGNGNLKQFFILEKKEKLLVLIKGIFIVIIFAYFFYRSIWAITFLLPLAWGYQKMSYEQLRLLKQEELCLRFKEMIEIVAGNLRAGYSVENAFLETGKEMRMNHPVLSPVNSMLSYIKKGLENNIPLEERLREAGKISGLNEVTEFAEVFSVAKLSGGNVIELINQFSVMIGDKIETEKEIKVALTARRGEQNIMNMVPFAILFYLEISSPGYFSSLYHNLSGIIVMTICMGIYLTAYSMSVKMLKIEV